MTAEQRDKDCARKASLEVFGCASSDVSDLENRYAIAAARISRELAESQGQAKPPSATHEEIARKVLREYGCNPANSPLAYMMILEALRLQSEACTPTPPVDPDVLAVRKLSAARDPEGAEAILAGAWDAELKSQVEAYRAGREAERAKP